MLKKLVLILVITSSSGLVLLATGCASDFDSQPADNAGHHNPPLAADSEQ